MTIGQKVRAKRLELGLTQEQLRDLTGLHQTHISDIEIGDVQSPTGDTIVKLADALQVTTDYLLRDEEANPSDFSTAPLGLPAPDKKPRNMSSTTSKFPKSRQTKHRRRHETSTLPRQRM